MLRKLYINVTCQTFFVEFKWHETFSLIDAVKNYIFDSTKSEALPDFVMIKLFHDI